MTETQYHNVCNLLTHATKVEKLDLNPEDALIIYYDRTRTPPSAMHEAMREAHRMFPNNKVVFISSDYRVVKLALGTKIPLKTDSWWERLCEWWPENR